MFDVKVLDAAIVALPDEGKAEIKKLVEIFEGYKTEVANLEEVVTGFEILSKNLQKENDELKALLKDSANIRGGCQ